MSEISKAIKARQAAIKNLQAEIDALRRAAIVMGEGTPAPATSTRRRPRSPAARKAASERMKAYWAKKKKTGK